MTKSHDFITLSDKLSWIKMLNLLGQRTMRRIACGSSFLFI
jgi:hypothetical protein